MCLGLPETLRVASIIPELRQLATMFYYDSCRDVPREPTLNLSLMFNDDEDYDEGDDDDNDNEDED